MLEILNMKQLTCIAVNNVGIIQLDIKEIFIKRLGVANTV